MSIKIVKNKLDVIDEYPPSRYNSWLDFWEKKNNKKASTCSDLFCSNEATKGGLVFIDGEEEEKEYITPLCDDHYHPPNIENLYISEFKLEPVT